VPTYAIDVNSGIGGLGEFREFMDKIGKYFGYASITSSTNLLASVLQ